MSRPCPPLPRSFPTLKPGPFPLGVGLFFGTRAVGIWPEENRTVGSLRSSAVPAQSVAHMGWGSRCRTTNPGPARGFPSESNARSASGPAMLSGKKLPCRTRLALSRRSSACQTASTIASEGIIPNPPMWFAVAAVRLSRINCRWQSEACQRGLCEFFLCLCLRSCSL
jgi:hypothetical protein